jgi:hypothetical protein
MVSVYTICYIYTSRCVVLTLLLHIPIGTSSAVLYTGTEDLLGLLRALGTTTWFRICSR